MGTGVECRALLSRFSLPEKVGSITFTYCLLALRRWIRLDLKVHQKNVTTLAALVHRCLPSLKTPTDTYINNLKQLRKSDRDPQRINNVGTPRNRDFPWTSAGSSSKTFGSPMLPAPLCDSNVLTTAFPSFNQDLLFALNHALLNFSRHHPP